MKSLRHLDQEPTALPLVVDDITELHAARLLLLLKICGRSCSIEGLTKLAKLDFFVRYPAFFLRIADHIERNTRRHHSVNRFLISDLGIESRSLTNLGIESGMVRYHYGPWDKRYYSVLPFLESRRLITVGKQGKAFVFTLTDEGKIAAKSLERGTEFSAQIGRMREVKRLVGDWSGNTLKDLIYQVFDEEIGKKELGEAIQ